MSVSDGIDINEFPLKLYKYRALEPFEYIADIICENRFHTAQFSDLNDPMEGHFNIKGDMKEEYLTRIKEAKERVRICSFSEIPTHPLLWAHYAGGFRGVCIEVEVTGSGPGFDLARVEYSSIRNAIGEEQAAATCLFPHMLLVRKTWDWKLEKEVRAFADDEFIYCGNFMRITGVYLGLKTRPTMERVIRQITPVGVSVWKTRIGRKNKIEADEEMPRSDNMV